MKALGVKSITLAGFDGFSPNINDNYYNASLRNSIEIEQLEEKNHSFANYIEQINKLIPICFVTKSIYENYFPKKILKPIYRHWLIQLPLRGSNIIYKSYIYTLLHKRKYESLKNSKAYIREKDVSLWLQALAWL